MCGFCLAFGVALPSYRYRVSRIPLTVGMAAINRTNVFSGESFGDSYHIDGLGDIASLVKLEYRTEVMVAL